MDEKTKLLELIAGLELALYRESNLDEPMYRLVQEYERKLKETRERLRVILYGTT